MNYSDKFGATSFQEISSPFAKGEFDISIPGQAAAPPTPSGFIKINDAELLFSGSYKREGSDLVISNDVRKLVVPDYFKGEVRPTLTSRDGATLSGSIVDALTGHVAYAQASGAPEPPKEIGSVVKLTGGATAIRNGVAVELNIGDKVYKGDVIQSGQGASLGITFIDGTAFSLSSNARMVLNEMVYDPNGSSNSSLLSLVQGTITFVAGQTAKNGNMRVDTPVATMGIRGTAVLVEIGADNGPTKFSVLVEPGNKVGSFNLYDKATGALLGSVSQAGQVTLVTPGGIGQQATAVELPKTVLDLQNERSLIKQVFEMFFPNYNDANPQGTKGIGSSVNNLADILNTGLAAAPGTLLFKFDAIIAGLSGPITVTATAVSTPPPIVITNATDIQPPEERGGRFNIADQVGPQDSRIIPYIAGSGRLETAEGPDSMPSGFPLRDLVTLNALTGEITYNPADFRFLADGEQAIFTFSFQSQSNEFIFVKTLTLTIDGLNDAPIFTVENFAAPVVEPGNTDSATTFSKQGTLTFTDLDFSDVASGYSAQTLGVTVTGKTTAIPNNATLLSFLRLDGIAKAVGSTQGVITETFSAPANAFDYLAAGETVNLAYQIRVTDADGASRTATLTVTVTGTNDGPTITGATTPASTSGDLLEDGVLTVSGVITFRDVDLSNTHTAVASHLPIAGSISSPLPGFNPATSSLGSLTVTVNENPNDANSIGTVSWVYSLDNLVAQRLAKGQVVTQTFMVTITDSSGATVTQPVTVTITGANDVPEIVLTPPNTGDPVTVDTGTVAEEASPDIDGNLSTTGMIVFKDVDLADTHTVGPPALKSSFVNGDLPGFDEGVVGVATHVDSVGTFTLDTTLIGSNTDLVDIGVVGWTFTVDNNHPVVQSLAEGQIITQVYTITITDSSGATISRDVTVTITGKNDAPVIDVTAPDAVQEGDAGAPALVSLDVADFVTIDDVDAIDARVPYVADTLVLESVDGTEPGTGTLSDLFTVDAVNGTVSYDRAAFDYLAEGEQVTATFTFSASSGPDTVVKTIMVTITGANDAPVITSNGGEPLTVAVAENTATVTTVTATDVDHDATIEYSIVNGPGSPDWALFTIDPETGELSFITAPDYEAGAGPYVVQVRASDGTTEDIQTITVNVTDVQEGPAVNDSGATTEDASVTLTQLIANDQSGFNITAVHSAQHGAATLVGGNVVFTPDANFSGMATFEYDISDGDDTDTATVTIDVAPVVDTATVDATSSAVSATEDQTISLGAITVGLGDVDGSETFVLKLSGFPAGATFSKGALVTTGPEAGTAWIITEAIDISAVASGALTMTPPPNYNGSFTLTVNAVVTDTAGLSTGSVSVSGTFSDTIAVTIDPVNDKPVLDLDGTDVSGTGFAGTVEMGGALTTIANVPSLTDADNSVFYGATVVLTDGHAGDFLVVMNGSEPGGESGTFPNGVSWLISGDADSISNPLTITFSGAVSASAYQFAIAQVRFGTDGDDLGPRHLSVTASDGSEVSLTAVAAIDVLNSNVAPVAQDDVIDINGVSNLFAMTGNLTSNDDPDFGDIFSISEGLHGASSATPDGEGVIKLAGTFGTLLLFAEDHPDSVVLSPGITAPGAFAGDYVFMIGVDATGQALANSPLKFLRPGDPPPADAFTYTITDSHDVETTADITVTYDINPVEVTVETDSGYDVSSLWADIHDGDLVANNPMFLRIINGDHKVEINAHNLTFGLVGGTEVTLTGGVIDAIRVFSVSTGLQLLDIDKFDVHATAFYGAVGPSGALAAFENLISTRSFDVVGGAGADVIKTGDFNDRIDTAGGANVVDAGAGNDLILVHDDAGWNIDGGDGIDTVRAVGSFVTGQGLDMGSELSNIEIIDLNNSGLAGAVSLMVDAEGAYNVNSTHIGRILGDSYDTVNFDSYFEGHAGQWIKATAPAGLYNPDGATPGIFFDTYFYNENGNTLATVYVQDQINVNYVPVLNFDSVIASASAFDVQGGQAKLTIDNALLLQNDVDPDGPLNVLDYPDIQQAPFQGNASSQQTGLTDYTLSANLMPGQPGQNQVVADGFFYRATDNDGIVAGPQAVNMMISNVTSAGAYIVPGSPLDDIMIGGNTADQFVFTAGSGNIGNDVIVNFQQGIDKINLQSYGPTLNEDNIGAFLTQYSHMSGQGRLIELDAHNSILVKGIATLTANDFILYPGGGGSNPYA